MKVNESDIANKNFVAKYLKTVAIYLLIGVVYLVFVRVFGFGIPCIFHLVTGLQCPGCGMTRAVVAISRLDFASAAQYNALSFTVFPLMALYLFVKGIKKNDSGKEFSPGEVIFLLVLFIVTVGYGVIRNI